jgi:DNA polymerase-3 subunit gamma/tau
MAHAYLFCGPRGVGKTSCARIFAKTINCLTPTAEGEACGECDSCRSISQGNSYNLVELDAASNNGVDDIRAITDQVNIPPQVGKYRVFIIDEVHMLSSAAFNAFLKTLEEPPSYAIFILATTEKHKVLPTILSRCQIYDFKRITIEDMVDHLAYVAGNEGITADRRALGVIARKADGAMRDALSIFDQIAASTRGNITYEAVIENLNVLDYDYFFHLVDAFAAGNVQDALLLYKEVRDKGFDSLFFVNSLAQHIRDLMVCADARTLPLLEMPEDVGKRLTEQSKALPLQWYYAAMRLLNDCDLNYRTASNKQFLVELTLIRLCQLLAPATPPFDAPDRPVALRDPATSAPASQPVATPAPQAAPAPAPQPTPQPIAKPIAMPATAPTGPAPAPLSAPTAPTSAAPAPTATPQRPHTFRMHQVQQTEDTTQARKREAFSDEDFARVWQELLFAAKDQHILASAMRTAKAVRRGETDFDLLVEHPAQVQAFETNMSKVLDFLRRRLNNDFLSISVSINPEKEVSKLLPPTEFVKKAITQNPALGEFLKSIDAEMA